MTRHARNCTAGTVYSYHERKKDAATSGYGTEKTRIGKDSVKDFDCCCLSLQPCKNPVITRDGYLYDKESILEYIITKKNEANRQLKEYEKQKKRDEAEKTELGAAENRANVEAFRKNEDSILSRSQAGQGSGPGPSTVSNIPKGVDKKLPSFWIPSLTPAAPATKLKKPDKTVYCPMSGKPLKAKDLIPMVLTSVKDPDDKAALISKKNRYMCAVTHDILGNSVPCAVLRPTGHVVTLECVEKIIKKDMVHPLTNEKLSEEDIITIQRGGTGFASTNEGLKSWKPRPVLQA